MLLLGFHPMATGNARNATKSSRDESRFKFQTEMCCVSGQRDANKAAVGTAAPMLTNGKTANLNFF